MSSRRDGGSLFCTLCGTLLAFDSSTFASCPLCKSQRSIKDLQGKEVWSALTAEDLVRRLNVDPVVLPEIDETTSKATEGGPQKAVVNEECPKCKNPQLEYYTRQLRSADEGQTVFYECPKCLFKFAHNS